MQLADKFVMVPHELYKDTFLGNSSSSSVERGAGTYRDVILNSKSLKGDSKVKLLAASNRTPIAAEPLPSQESSSSSSLFDNTVSTRLNNSGNAFQLDEPSDDSYTRVTPTTTIPWLSKLARSSGVAGNNNNEEVNDKRLNYLYTKIFEKLETRLKYENRKRNASQMFEILAKSSRIKIDPHTLRFIIDGSASNAIDAVQFLYDMQTHNKLIPDSYKTLLQVVDMPQSLILNHAAKMKKLLPRRQPFEDYDPLITPVLKRMRESSNFEEQQSPTHPRQSTANNNRARVNARISSQDTTGPEATGSMALAGPTLNNQEQDFTPRKRLRMSDVGADDDDEYVNEDQWSYTFK